MDELTQNCFICTFSSGGECEKFTLLGNPRKIRGLQTGSVIMLCNIVKNVASY